MKLPAGVKVIERGWLSSNNIVLVDGGTATLVDTGYGAHLEQTLALIERALAGARLERILNTHCHSDHVGGNAGVQRRYGVPITVPIGEAPLIERWDEQALLYSYADQICERFDVAATCAPGDVLRLAGIDWQVIAAPGHDRHAVMFYAPAERLLISGDALWEDGFGVVFEALQGRLEAFDEARATLEQIAALDVRTVIPGHGRPFEGVEHALERAHKRLAGYVADPMRLARHLAKVMLTFALLERRSLELDKLPEYVSRVPILRDVNTHWLKMTPPDFARYLVEDLERVGAIERTEGVIRPRVAA